MHMISPFTHILCGSEVTNPQVWQVQDEESVGCMHNSELEALNNSEGNTNEYMYKTHNTYCFIARKLNAILHCLILFLLSERLLKGFTITIFSFLLKLIYVFSYFSSHLEFIANFLTFMSITVLLVVKLINIIVSFTFTYNWDHKFFVSIIDMTPNHNLVYLFMSTNSINSDYQFWLIISHAMV